MCFLSFSLSTLFPPHSIGGLWLVRCTLVFLLLLLFRCCHCLSHWSYKLFFHLYFDKLKLLNKFTKRLRMLVWQHFKNSIMSIPIFKWPMFEHGQSRTNSKLEKNKILFDNQLQHRSTAYHLAAKYINPNANKLVFSLPHSQM